MNAFARVGHLLSTFLFFSRPRASSINLRQGESHIPVPSYFNCAQFPPGSILIGIDTRGRPVPVQWPPTQRADFLEQDVLRVPWQCTDLVIITFSVKYREHWLLASPPFDKTSAPFIQAWPLDEAYTLPRRLAPETLIELDLTPPPETKHKPDRGVVRALPPSFHIPRSEISAARIRLSRGLFWHGDHPTLDFDLTDQRSDPLSQLFDRWTEVLELLGFPSDIRPATMPHPSDFKRRPPFEQKKGTLGWERLESWRGQSPLGQPPGDRAPQGKIWTLDTRGVVQPRTDPWLDTVRSGELSFDEDGRPLFADPVDPQRIICAAGRLVFGAKIASKWNVPTLWLEAFPTAPGFILFYPALDSAHDNPKLSRYRWQDYGIHVQGRDGEMSGILPLTDIEELSVRLEGVGPWEGSVNIPVSYKTVTSILPVPPKILRRSLEMLRNS